MSDALTNGEMNDVRQSAARAAAALVDLLASRNYNPRLVLRDDLPHIEANIARIRELMNGAWAR